MQLAGEVLPLERDFREASGLLYVGVGLALFFAVGAILGAIRQHSVLDAVPLGLAALALAGGVLGWTRIVRYNRRLVFTSEGIWHPKGGGQFIPWVEIRAVRFDRRFLVITTADSSLRVYANSFKNPYALSRVVRDHVSESIGGHLPLDGEV